MADCFAPGIQLCYFGSDSTLRLLAGLRRSNAKYALHEMVGPAIFESAFRLILLRFGCTARLKRGCKDAPELRNGVGGIAGTVSLWVKICN